LPEHWQRVFSKVFGVLRLNEGEPVDNWLARAHFLAKCEAEHHARVAAKVGAPAEEDPHGTDAHQPRAIHVPIYNRNIQLHITHASFNAALKEHAPEAHECDFHLGRCVMSGKTNMILIGWFNQRKGTLVHELAHAVFFILETAGVNVNADDSEAYCYLLDYLCKELLP
jgi:hypothetical protein